MSFAYLPWYTGDYLRDTRHLSPLKHGVYLLLLAHCWDQKGPIPLDEQECAGIANCRSSDEIESLRYIVARYFIRMEDGYYNARMQKEIERAESISHARSDAGRKGYQAKAKHLLSKSQATATTPTPTPTPIPIPIPTTTPKKSKSRGERFTLTLLPDAWLEFVNAERQDLDPQQTFDRFRDYWQSVPGQKGTKLDWFATWRNWVRNERVMTGRQQTPAQRQRELERLLDERDGDGQA